LLVSRSRPSTSGSSIQVLDKQKVMIRRRATTLMFLSLRSSVLLMFLSLRSSVFQLEPSSLLNFAEWVLLIPVSLSATAWANDDARKEEDKATTRSVQNLPPDTMKGADCGFRTQQSTGANYDDAFVSCVAFLLLGDGFCLVLLALS